MKILIAEDNEVDAHLLARGLKKAIEETKVDNIIPEFFITGYLREALQKAVQMKADVTFLDPNLIDSPDWRHSLLAISVGLFGLPRFHPPVCIITGMEKTDELLKECREAGAVQVYHKPWGEGALNKIVSDVARAIYDRRMSEQRNAQPK